MSGTLYVVATPIGNLEDITLRALRVLRSVGVIAAEDTRRTAKLLAHYGITTPTISFHAHNAHARLLRLLNRLEQGDSIAVVSDAGTPGISDPGRELVQACVERGVPIEPVPGPSAVLAALVASGLPTESVTLLGFPPSRGQARKSWLERLSNLYNTVVFFEAPHRIKSTLSELSLVMGARPITVAREMTKAHQEILRGSVRSVSASLVEARGEFTVVLGPQERENFGKDVLTVERAHAEFCHLTKIVGFGRREAIKELANRYGYRSREVYALLEKPMPSVE